MLHNAAIRLEWDDTKKKEVEAAKRVYVQAKNEGRKVLTIDRKPLECFKPSLLGIIIDERELLDNQFVTRIYDETGDRRLIWDANRQEQVKEAAAIFQKYVEKGWRAYATDTKGIRKCRIFKFDLDKEEIFFEEKSNVEKLAELPKAFPKEKIEKQNTEKLSTFLGAFPTAVKPVAKTEKLKAFVKEFQEIKLLPKTFPG